MIASDAITKPDRKKAGERSEGPAPSFPEERADEPRTD
jgi:hypothetical protein